MLALQEPQRYRSTPDASAYRTRLEAFDEAYRNMQTCSGNLVSILAAIPAGMEETDWRARIARAAQAHEAARADCMIASARLNEFLIAEIVAAGPVIEEAAPDHEQPAPPGATIGC